MTHVGGGTRPCAGPLDWSWRLAALAQWRFSRRPKRYGTPTVTFTFTGSGSSSGIGSGTECARLVAPRVSQDFALA